MELMLVPQVVTRLLSQLEVRVLDKHPEIQEKPSKTLSDLARAVKNLEEPDTRPQ
jgi:hypothetical protein